MQRSIFIGLDVHKATISVGVAVGERGGEVRSLGTVSNRPDHVRKLVDKLASNGAQLHFCYEAGPCGYGLHRQLVELGHECIVVAPSLIPVKSGDRVKTDRRDALMLAKLHRAGELTAVWVPDAAHEAMRDLVRARATAIRVAGKARQHMQGFLLRHGRNYPGKNEPPRVYRRAFGSTVRLLFLRNSSLRRRPPLLRSARRNRWRCASAPCYTSPPISGFPTQSDQRSSRGRGT